MSNGGYVAPLLGTIIAPPSDCAQCIRGLQFQEANTIEFARMVFSMMLPSLHTDAFLRDAFVKAYLQCVEAQVIANSDAVP